MSDRAPSDAGVGGAENHQLRKGAVLLGSAAVLFPVKDALIKAGAGEVSAIAATGIYFFAQTLLIVTVSKLARRGKSDRGPGLYAVGWGQLSGILGRSLALVTSVALFFAAVQAAPIALCVVLFTTNALFLVLLAPWLLNEPLTARKLMCVACGFAGVGLVMAPSGQETVDWRLGLALASAFSFALYLVATKRLAHDIQASTLMLSDGLLGSLAAAAVLALGDLLAPGNAVITLATVPTAAGITLAMLAGAVGTLSSLLVIKAMRLAPASVIAPLGYVEIVSAAAIGVFIFHDPLTFAAVAGAALIVMSCWVASSSTKREPPVQKQDP